MNQTGNPQQGRPNADRPDSPTPAAGKAPNAVPALELLRDRVVHAVEEITRLRLVNAELAARVNRLEEVHGISAGSSSFIINEDPDVLKEKIAGYIKTIDAYLEEIDEDQAEAE